MTFGVPDFTTPELCQTRCSFVVGLGLAGVNQPESAPALHMSWPFISCKAWYSRMP